MGTRPGAHRRHPILVFALFAGIIAGAAAPAAAGGAWMTSVAPRYEPGETATLVGYFEGGTDGARRPVFISSLPRDESDNLPEESTPVRVGSLTVERTSHEGYLAYRAFTSFQIPSDLAPGVYEVSYDWDNGFIGDLIGGQVVVGMDPTWQLTHEWAIDEPEIVNLADDAVIAFSGGTITAGELKTRDAPAEASAASSDEAASADESAVITVRQSDPPATSSPAWPLGSALLALVALVVVVYLARRGRHAVP